MQLTQLMQFFYLKHSLSVFYFFFNWLHESALDAHISILFNKSLHFHHILLNVLVAPLNVLLCANYKDGATCMGLINSKINILINSISIYYLFQVEPVESFAVRNVLSGIIKTPGYD